MPKAHPRARRNNTARHGQSGVSGPQIFTPSLISTAHGLWPAATPLKRGAEARKLSAQYPSTILWGISIRDQMQVTDVSAGKRYIGNIANPQLIGRGWDKALYQVLPLMVTMVGIGCAPGFAGRKHQAVSTKQRVEAVATGHEPLPKRR